MLKAQEMLDAYAQAKMVVTTRLHCALPCLAFGTPVLFVTDNPKDPRFEGMLELMRHCSGRELHKETLIDWHHPTPNPADIGKFRSSLETICKTFVAQA
jgi:polysaccharide pyruvyl transferase WcaK-like protein